MFLRNHAVTTRTHCSNQSSSLTMLDEAIIVWPTPSSYREAIFCFQLVNH